MHKDLEKDLTEQRQCHLWKMLKMRVLSQLRPVSLYNLLSRDSTTLDKESFSYSIKEKRVLITGAGGVLALKLLGNALSTQLSR